MAKSGKKSTYTKFITPPFRVSYPTLTEPKPGPDGVGELKYSVRMLFPKKLLEKDGDLVKYQKDADGNDLLKAMKEGAKKSAIDYFGEPLPKALKKPFKDGDEESDYPSEKGHWVASARTKNKPGVVNKKNTVIEDHATINELIYSGCWCRATVLIGSTDIAGSKCVHMILNNIQKLKDDARFDNRVAANVEFEPVDISDDDFDNDESAADDF